MYNDKRLLAIIPARGGSKGIPHKNIIDLDGKPLIEYTIDASIHSNYIDYTFVSTDDVEIATIAKNAGAKVPFLRPVELALDTSKTIDAVLYSVRKLEEIGECFDAIVLLQATQPLRTVEDVDAAIRLYFESGCKSLASVCEVDDNPVLIRTIQNDSLIRLLNVESTVRRQDMPVYYRVNGCIYINSISQLNEKTSFNDNEYPYVMDREHSVDIDEMKDVYIAKYYLRMRNSHSN